MLLLPSPAFPAYNVITAIDGVDYELVYTYDEHRDLWRFGVNSERGDAVMGHRPLLPFVPMRPNAFASALEGVFALIAPLPTDDAYEALTWGLWSVVYGLPAEIAELADSLADLAGDADVPVVPIDVIYPPNNAVLSNPVVTFNGTGPANQLLFARGESIQVDSMGSWVWTHTFSDPSPVVVFEGESGQRATVRFSIIMQPLTIDPVGEDIDGSMYVFTEDVEVTGSATPNSAITVNGQPVGVGGDGLWSVELTLQTGQSHTITAQAGDGQVAQTSVYVWGEPDVLALQPPVWLDPSDVATLFVDSAGITPVQFSGDPVGLWKNKGTLGAVGDAAQPVSASRPVWADAGGLTGFSQTVYLDAAGVHLKAPCTIVVSYDLAGSSAAQRLLTDSPNSAFLGGYRVHTQTGAMRLHVPPPSNRHSQVLGGDSAAFIGHIDTDGSVQTFSDVNQAGGSLLTIEPNWEGNAGMSLNNTSSAFGGTIKHVLVFDRVLSEVERGQLFSYLEAQHGI